MNKIEERPTLDAYPTFLISRAALNDIIEACSWLTDDVSLRFNRDGMWARFTDPAHVAMTELHLPKDGFIEYEYLKECVLNINLNAIKDLLRHVEKSEKVLRMRIVAPPAKSKKEESVKHLVITVDSPFDSNGFIHYGMPLLDNELLLPKFPSWSLPTAISLSMPLMYKAVKVLEHFTDEVELEYDSGVLSLAGENDDRTRSITMMVDAAESPAARCLFQVEYFMGLVRAHKNAKEAVLKMRTDHPIILTATMPSGLSVMAAIAPMIKDD